MENKKFTDSEFVKNFLSVYAANGGTKTAEEMLNRTVGNNGYTLGQEFTLTGEIQVKVNDINGTKQTYIILKTAEGTELSLMALMGVSSLKGYDLTNAVSIDFVGNDKKQATRETKSDLVEGFDFSDAWQPASRNLLELAGMIAEGAVKVAGKTVRYLGTAVKPIVAKKDGESNGEKFKAGYRRAIETRLWAVE